MIEALLVLAFLAIPVCVIAGLIKPRLVAPWMAAPNRWMILPPAAALFVAGCGLAYLAAPPHENTVVAAADAGQDPQENRPAPIPLSPAFKPVPVLAIEMPSAESAYIAAVEKARKDYGAAPNELKKSNIKRDMIKDIHAAVPHGAARGWTGRLTALRTNGDGKAIVAVEIAPGMTVQTWNNDFSDMEDRTLIENRSPLYNAIADLTAGQRVAFDAQLIRITDLTEKGAVEAPEMLARFSRIKAIP
jgi:hypothetical protein